MELLLPQLGLFFWTLVIFLGFFFVLRKVAWKPIITALEKREQTISDSLEQASQARDEMAKLKSDNEALLKEARVEREKILKEANDRAKEIVKKAKEEAKAAMDAEMAKASQQIEAERKAAVNEIRNTAGTLAVEVAEKILRKELKNKKAQEELASKLVSELSDN